MYCLLKALIWLSLLPSPTTTKKTLLSTALRMEQQGLVDIGKKDPTIRVSLMYSRADNFCGTVLYHDLDRAYLHPLAADALVKAQRSLKQIRPDLSLKVYDAARPMSIQQQMWDRVKATSKRIYVSNPAHGGGLHNYGLAVDITLCDARGDTLPMGTKIDHLGKEAHIDNEKELVRRRVMTEEARQNRILLRKVMTDAGYKPLRSEWWHFNLRSREEAKRHFKVIR